MAYGKSSRAFLQTVPPEICRRSDQNRRRALFLIPHFCEIYSVFTNYSYVTGGREKKNPGRVVAEKKTQGFGEFFPAKIRTRSISETATLAKWRK